MREKLENRGRAGAGEKKLWEVGVNDYLNIMHSSTFWLTDEMKKKLLKELGYALTLSYPEKCPKSIFYGLLHIWYKLVPSHPILPTQTPTVVPFMQFSLVFPLKWSWNSRGPYGSSKKYCPKSLAIFPPSIELIVLATVSESGNLFLFWGVGLT